MKGTSKFQIVFIGVFIAALVFAFLVFSDVIPLGKKKSSDNGGTGTVVVWGTMPFTQIAGTVDQLRKAAKSFGVVYVQKDATIMDQDLIEQLASGTGPDLVIFPHDHILRFTDKIYPLPYASYPQVNFTSTFIQEATLMLVPTGVLGLPLAVDPLVMYYNQNMFDTAGVSAPPATWEELVAVTVPALTKHQPNDVSRLTQSAVAMGTSSNILNAKDILSTIFMQVGLDPVIIANGSYTTPFLTTPQVTTAGKVIEFYTGFSNPTNPNYSWNRSQKQSRDAFISEQLAIYFGYASELPILSKMNPNLRFTVTKMPQSSVAKSAVTAGKLYSVSVMKTSKNLSTAFIAAGMMSEKEFAGALAKDMFIAPARRDLLGSRPEDPYSKVFNESALIARGWRDPNPIQTTIAFNAMIDSVVRGENKGEQAAFFLGEKLQSLLRLVPKIAK